MFEKEVMAGIGLLERVFEGENWRPYIDRDKLHMGSDLNCMLGQLAVMIAPPEQEDAILSGAYSRYIYAVDILTDREDVDDHGPRGIYASWMESHGFELPGMPTWGKYAILRDTWLRLMDSTDPDKKESPTHD